MFNETDARKYAVSVSALKWFIRYIYHRICNLFLSNLRFSSLRHRWPQPILVVLFRPFGVQITFQETVLVVIVWQLDLQLRMQSVTITSKVARSNAFGFIVPKHFTIIWFSNLSTLSVPDEGYSRNVSCAINLIFTFSLVHHIIKSIRVSMLR